MRLIPLIVRTSIRNNRAYRYMVETSYRQLQLKTIPTQHTTDDQLFWWRDNALNYNRFVGINREFINEFSAISYIDLNDTGVYSKDEIIGVIENEKTVYEITAPSDNYNIVRMNDELDIDYLNEEPENMDNFIYEYNLQKYHIMEA